MGTPPSDPSPDESRDEAMDEERPQFPAQDMPAEIEFAEATVDDEEVFELSSADFLEEDDEEDTAPLPDSSEPVLPPRLPPTLPPPAPARPIVLIGAGQAHLQILKWWHRQPIPGCELTLVTAFDQVAYSSMLPGTLSGLYQPDEMLIDIPRLCAHCGVRLIVDRANRLDPLNRMIEFAHQPALPFDVASINIGSVPAAEPLWQSHRILISVKPLSTFLQRFAVRFHELVEQWRMAPGDEMLQIVVVGAGASGIELALCLEQHKHELELPADVRIVDGSSTILTEFSARARRRVEKLLALRGIDLSLGSPVVDCDDEGPGHLVLENGQRIRADLVIWAAGASPPMALRGFDLPKSPRGFLATRPTLQSTADVPVFVTGDVADFETYSLPKAGIYASAQAAMLWKNLKYCLSGRPLRSYRPQSPLLRILTCGDGTAILDFKGYTLHSGLAWTLKSWHDRNWVRQFQVE